MAEHAAGEAEGRVGIGGVHRILLHADPELAAALDAFDLALVVEEEVDHGRRGKFRTVGQAPDAFEDSFIAVRDDVFAVVECREHALAGHGCGAAERAGFQVVDVAGLTGERAERGVRAPT